MRHTADTINDDELDALYAERDRLQRSVQDWRTAAGASMTVADQLGAQLDNVRRAMASVGLIGDALPDSDDSLVALVKQGLDALQVCMPAKHPQESH
ncbi:hypothetical protein [Streptomyces violascens]|uniref:hypothetical protein n=1 Tax=Streptomyces violascens TaxID=67381 RepID=UPI00367D4E67